MIQQDHIIKGSGHYNDRSHSRKVTILPRLVATDTAVLDMPLVCQVISQDHVIEGSSHFIVRTPSRQVIILQSLVVIGEMMVGDIIGFVCRVTLQDHVIKGLNDFMVRSPSR